MTRICLPRLLTCIALMALLSEASAAEWALAVPPEIYAEEKTKAGENIPGLLTAHDNQKQM